MAYIPSIEEKKQAYEEILALYDCAEEMVNAVGEIEYDEQETALTVIEPVTNQLVESADVLTDTFIIYGETAQELDEHNKKRAETAIRKIFESLSAFRKRTCKLILNMEEEVEELTDGIRIHIVELQERVQKKKKKMFDKIFSLMLWLGDYMVRLTRMLEKLGTGIEPIFVLPKFAQSKSAEYLRGKEAQQGIEHGWALG